MIVLCLILTILVATCQGGTFQDDRGVTHEIRGKPSIVTFARTAVTLSHFGERWIYLRKKESSSSSRLVLLTLLVITLLLCISGLGRDQLVGVYGEYANDGSDYDFTNLLDGSTYPADPTPEEMELITSVTHISPGCLKGYCQEFDLEIFRSLKPDYIVMHGYRGNLWGFDADTEKQVVNVIGRPIIYIDVAQQGANCISENEQQNCYGKSMIEVVEQYYDLAQALGIAIPKSVEEDRRALCKAAEEFQDAAELAHTKGVRAMAGYISVNQFRNATSYLAYPPDDMVLRMFEELGMPLLHPGKCQAPGCSRNYFWEWIPTQEYFPECAPGQDRLSCNDEVLYPVDMWLYDHRTTFTFLSQEFRQSFPDPAVLEGQFEYWPIGGGIISYRHAAEILSIMAPALAKMERIHDSTSCTIADVTSILHAQNGLSGGSYACFDRTKHRQTYLQCPSVDTTLSTGALIGICIGSAAGFFVLLALVWLWCRKRRSRKEKTTGVEEQVSSELTNRVCSSTDPV